jgi:hypothetical protein
VSPPFGHREFRTQAESVVVTGLPIIGRRYVRPSWAPVVALPYGANGGYGYIDDPYPPFAPNETGFSDRTVRWERDHRLVDASTAPRSAQRFTRDLDGATTLALWSTYRLIKG